MFNIFTDAIESTLNVTDDTFDMITGGERTPNKRDIAKMLDAGLTVAAIAGGYDVAEDVITAIISTE